MMRDVFGHHVIGSHDRYSELSGDLTNRVAQQKVILDMDNVGPARAQKVANRVFDEKRGSKTEFGIKKKREGLNTKHRYAVLQRRLGAKSAGRANDRNFVASPSQGRRKAIGEISGSIHIGRIGI